MQLEDIAPKLNQIKENIQKVIVGKSEEIDYLLVALLASRHVLLEDVPGTGKTLLAKSLAASINCEFNRVQFTPDLLPSDVTGVNIYRQQTGQFEFNRGPIFTHVLLADEINRATPRTQASLLESMEEKQVTVDGNTISLEQPFLVIATQNPIESQGTFPLPEAQLDRFFIKIHLGYPNREEGIEILKRFKEAQPLDKLESVINRDELIEAQNLFTQVEVSEAIYTYMIELTEKTREHEEIVMGLSPRGTQALLRSVQALASIKGRSYVIPDDVKEMFSPIVAHRLVFSPMVNRSKESQQDVLKSLIESVTVPTESNRVSDS
ncbi:MoxR-like ATPase [Pelagirhabdus alkalitolerans]|uniref:MoxR-like ATPase n=1 Tax=Pelagirhabdus alkalitolerans TaxID=1612202 RepID=A0A1G6GZW3_9BACI|nr:MoxR family ATPase [Pelagirhabdus alkalitolerans]SDB86656.1 MoxR-like ATPase [Pelagirhabdus alkalitolerans]